MTRTITTALVAIATYEGLCHNPAITAMAWILAGICWALATDHITIDGSN